MLPATIPGSEPTDDPTEKPFLDLGDIPYGPTRFLDTPWHAEAEITHIVAIKEKGIVLVDGPTGAGKTTSVSQFASHARFRLRYLCMDQLTTPKGAMETVFEALTGVQINAKSKELKKNLIQLFGAGDVGIIVDEAHLIGVKGMQQIRIIHDEVQQRTGHGFPCFLVGFGVEAAVRTAPELEDRIASTAFFKKPDGDELLTFVRAISPAMTDVPDTLIQRLDKQYAHGSIRRWSNIVGKIDLLWPNRQTALTTVEADQVLLTIGRPR